MKISEICSLSGIKRVTVYEVKSIYLYQKDEKEKISRLLL